MTVEIIEVSPVVVEVVDQVVQQIEIVDLIEGPPGPPGPAGSGTVFDQTSPAATWTIPHQLGRRPIVELFLNDLPTNAPMVVTDTHVIVTWPYPVAGSATLI